MKKSSENEIHIDAIAMKRKIQRVISAETRGMSPAEKVKYYAVLAQEWRERRPARRPASGSQ